MSILGPLPFVLPALTKVTIFAEIAADVVLTIGTLELTTSFIHADPEVLKGLAITQSILSGIFGLWLSFSGPGMAFIKDFGVTTDDFVSKYVKKFFSPPAREITANVPSLTSLDWKLRTAQGVFCVLALNNLFTGITMDYQQLMLLGKNY